MVKQSPSSTIIVGVSASTSLSVCWRLLGGKISAVDRLALGGDSSSSITLGNRCIGDDDDDELSLLVEDGCRKFTSTESSNFEVSPSVVVVAPTSLPLQLEAAFEEEACAWRSTRARSSG